MRTTLWVLLITAAGSSSYAQSPLPAPVHLIEDFVPKPAPPSRFRPQPRPFFSAVRPAAACGHILTHNLKPDADPRIVLPLNRPPASEMPKISSLPACPEDVR